MAVVEIYSKAYCPFCVRAKALLAQKSVIYREIEIDKNPELRPEMITRSKGITTVPQIFINNLHIGGCDDLFELNYKAKLDDLLAS